MTQNVKRSLLNLLYYQDQKVLIVPLTQYQTVPCRPMCQVPIEDFDSPIRDPPRTHQQLLQPLNFLNIEVLIIKNTDIIIHLLFVRFIN